MFSKYGLSGMINKISNCLTGLLLDVYLNFKYKDKQFLASKRYGILAQAIANFFLVNARRIGIKVLCINQVFVKTKGYV